MRTHEAGYTIVELLIGAAIAAIVLGGLVTFASRLTQWTSAADARVQAEGATGHLFERLSSEAAIAWAVYVPAVDSTGAPNTDGHEIALFTEDGSHRPFSWAYRYDAAAKTVTRYVTSGATPMPGDIMQSIDAFEATTIPVTQLANDDPLFAGAAATNVSYAFPGSAAVGGNALVKLHVAARGVDRTILLASANAPTSFTVVVTYTPSPPPIATPTPTPLSMTNPTSTP